MRSLALLAAAIAFATAPAQSKQQVVGVWKYDVATMKLELNANGKKQLNDPKTGKQARQFVANMQKSLGAMLKTMKVTFKADQTITISGGSPQSTAGGTWQLNGREIKVIMTDAKQTTPKMIVDPSGKRIHTSYTDPNFGVGKVDLVRGK